MHRITLIALMLIMILGTPISLNAQTTLSKSEQKHLAKEKKKEKRKKDKEQRKKEKLEKKKEKKEKKHKNKKAAKEEEAKKDKAAKEAVNKVPKYVPTKMKPRYRIDILVTLYLDELAKAKGRIEKEKIKEKASAGVSFYEGVTMAADSLKKAGFNIDIYIHDITSVSELPASLIGNGKLDSTDLIIGALQAKDINQFADFAKKKHINFVSALSATDAGVKENPYFTLLQPSLRSHCQWIAANIASNYTDKKVSLLYRTSNQPDSNAYKYLIGDNSKKSKLQLLLCNQLPDKKSLTTIIDSTKPNVLIVSVLDGVYADSLLHALSLNFPGTHFTVYGMPSWNGISSIKKAHAFPNMSINITYPFNFSATTGMVPVIDKNCTNDYDHIATELNYRAYETLFWYAALLKNYGTIFNEKYSDNTAAPITKFEVKMQWDKTGNILYNENNHIFISTFEGGVNRVE